MNEMPTAAQGIEPERDDSYTPINALRASIEREHMFKTSIKGFNKREVQDYLDNLSEQYRKTLREQSEELARVRKENEQLCATIEEQKERLVSALAEERRKVRAELDLQEGLLENLRERNSSLMAENQAQQLRIASLTDRNNYLHTVISDRSTQLDTLGDRLSALLNGKIVEFGEVIEVWKKEYHDVLSSERQQVVEL